MDDPEKRLRTRWEACKFIDGHTKAQPHAIRVKGGETVPQVVVCLLFINAYPAGSFFRPVDQVLPTTKCRMVSAPEASQMSNVGLGHLDVFSMTEVRRVGGGVEMNGVEQACRTTALRVATPSWAGG